MMAPWRKMSGGRPEPVRPAAARGRALSVAIAVVLGMAITAPVPAQAQADRETLADIRQELSQLQAEIRDLRSELSPGSGGSSGIGGGSVLERVDAVETELRRLTGWTEAMEIRIQRIVTDGANRIGDLEFRIVELEGGDFSSLGTPEPLGGAAPSVPGVSGPALPDLGAGAGAGPGVGGGDGSTEGGAFLAVGEREDFDRARDALDSGDYDAAIELLTRFTETYPGGPLSAEAHFLRGQAHAGLEQSTRAARAWLDSFNADPDGRRAAEALFMLGQSLASLGQREEGCLMLDEVGRRFPDSELAPQASAARRDLGCS